MGLVGTKKSKPATAATSASELYNAMGLDALRVPAQMRAITAQAANEEGLLNDDQLLDDGRYVFAAEISSMALDAYFTHMADSTLRNFANEAATGVSLLDSHDGRKLGIGYSAGGRYEEENGNGRAVATFYIVPGIRFGGQHSFAGTDDYIRAIEGEVVRDMSVGFYGGRWVCDLCHQPYYGFSTDCHHLAGWEYEIEIDGRLQRKICTVTIHDAHLSEVSLVYDGATPGAMILKAEDEARAGRLSPTQHRMIERSYRIQLPDQIAANVNREQGENMDEETGIEREVETEGQVAATEQDPVVVPASAEEPSDAADRVMLIEVRQAVEASPAPADESPAGAIRWLTQQLAAAQAEVTRLQPLADQGRAYHDDLVNQALVEGVRALGETFPEETYRAMLAGAPLEHIRQVRDTFAAQAADRFPGGRQTRDAKDEKPTPQTPATPAAAYGARQS